MFDDPSKGSNDIVPERQIVPDSVETTIIFLHMASVVWHRIVISRGLVLGGPCFTAGRERDRRFRHFRVASEVSGSSPGALWWSRPIELESSSSESVCYHRRCDLLWAVGWIISWVRGSLKIEYSISFDLLIDLRDCDLYRDHTHTHTHRHLDHLS